MWEKAHRKRSSSNGGTTVKRSATDRWISNALSEVEEVEEEEEEEEEAAEGVLFPFHGWL
jgi:hypothetical protein